MVKQLAELIDDRSTYAVALSVATGAINAGINRKAAFNLLVKHRPEDRDALARQWPAIWSRCSASVADTSRTRAATARRTLAHVLTPVEKSNRGTANARRLVAIVGTRMLANAADWRSIQIGLPTLSVLLGTAFGAQPASKQAQQRRWLVVQSRGRGHAPVLKLNRVRAGLDWTGDWLEAVDALIENRDDNMTACLIRSAAHPAFDVLGATAWVEAVCLSLMPKPTLLSYNASRAARALLEQWNYPVLDAGALAGWLDHVASETGAAEARRELVQRRDAAAEARAEAVADIKRIRAAVPVAPNNADALGEFFEAMLRLMLTEPEHAREIERTLVKRVDKRHDSALERWLGWLVQMYVERAPVEDDVDEQKTRQRRAAVASAVVAALMHGADTVEADDELLPHDAHGRVPEAALTTARAALSWVTAKRNPGENHEDRSNTD